MISPAISPTWLDESDFMLGEPSLMATGICTMSVFDKFDWDADILGSDTEELLDKICIKSENELSSVDEKSNTEFGSFSSIFPDLLDDATRNSNLKDADCLKPISPPLSPDSLSPPPSVASPSYSQNECSSFMKFEDELNIEEKPGEYNIGDYGSMIAAIGSCTPTSVNLTSVVPVLAEIKCERDELSTTTTTTVASTPLITSAATMKPAIIRIPVKRNSSAVLSGNGGGRIKAVVVCPDRSKSIVCNVVRSTNKGIVIQKPINRNWLNVSSNGNIRHESSKLPIKVNVISSKDSELLSGSLRNLIVKNELPVEVKADASAVTSSNFITGTSNVESSLMSPTKIKVVEWDEMRPETPQSLVGSDDEFYSFSSPNKISVKSYFETFQDDFMKSCLLDEDNLCSESYKCVPPAEVTGQMQPVIPDVFKYTPNSSPNNSDSMLEPFYTQLDNSSNNNNRSSSNQSQFYNKAAANVHHDYGFTCRTQKATTTTTTSLASIFNVDSLGIQTPSASEPPTDSDDDDTLLNDVTLLNKDFDCLDLEREQKEYFENLKRQLKEAELVIDEKNNHFYKSSTDMSVKERKLAGRNRKRKHSRESCSLSALSKSSDCTRLGAVPGTEVGSFYGTNISANDYGTLKTRLPVKGNSSKKRKIGTGGRIFSPSERHLHNTNEQVRRIEMRQSFEELRRLIPNLIDKTRAPKVSILQEAKMYCDDLLHTDLKLQCQVTALRCQQERLRGSLSRLRKNAAYTYRCICSYAGMFHDVFADENESLT